MTRQFGFFSIDAFPFPGDDGDVLPSRLAPVTAVWRGGSRRPGGKSSSSSMSEARGAWNEQCGPRRWRERAVRLGAKSPKERGEICPAKSMDLMRTAGRY